MQRCSVLLTCFLISVGCGGSTLGDIGDDGGGTGTGAGNGNGNGTPGDDASTSSDATPPKGVPGKPDASTTPPGTCGTETCSSTEECCLTQQGSACVATGQCNGVTVDCTGPSSCTAGEVCCATQSNGGATATCAKTCNGVELCDTDADCAKGETCIAAGPVKICRPGGTTRDAGGPPGRDAGGPPGRDAGGPPGRDAGGPPGRDGGGPPGRDGGGPPGRDGGGPPRPDAGP